MKLTDIEKSTLKLLHYMGYNYVIRDSVGLRAYKIKPELHISQSTSFRMWMSSLSAEHDGYIRLHSDKFPQVGYHETEPYIITKNATLKLLTKKAVAVWHSINH